MARIETSNTFPVEREVGFQYITEPTNWPKFWPDLVDIPDLDRARWRDPGDSVRLRMRLAGRIADLRMTLDELSPPALVRYHTVQQGMPTVSSR
jgi:Polyketide cyclase / dehydrase and lipid transport